MCPVYFVNYVTGLYPSILSQGGEEVGRVQTGNIVYKINRAHGLHIKSIGKEDLADPVEGSLRLRFYPPMTFFIKSMTSAGWFNTSFASASISSP